MAKDLLKHASFPTAPPPFDPTAIAKAAGISRVIVRTDFPAGASLQRDSEGHFVAVAGNTSHGRQNFSVLHEVAHYLIGKAAVGLGRLSADEANAIKAGYEEEENICDRIATELLLPDSAFRARMLEAGVPPTWRGLRRLANLFAASVDATVRRFGEFYEGSLLIERWSRAGETAPLSRSLLAVSKDLRPFASRGGRSPTTAPEFVMDLLGRDSNEQHETIVRELPLRGQVRAVRIELWQRRVKGARQVLLLAVHAGPNARDDQTQRAKR